MAQLDELIKDVEANKSKVSNLSNTVKVLGPTVTFEQFCELIKQNKLPLVNNVLRTTLPYSDAKKSNHFEKSNFFKAIFANSKSSASDSELNVSKKSNAKSSEKNVSYCKNHEGKKYEYGLHAVTFDSTGRCVDSRIISESKLKCYLIGIQTKFIRK